MSLELKYLWGAPLVVQIHVLAAFAALLIGIVVFSMRKGTYVHRNMGKFWVAAMATTALSSFFIHEIRSWGPFSAIHLISVGTVTSLIYAVYAIRRGNVQEHEYTMKGLFVGGLLVAGSLSLVSGRLMNEILFSQSSTNWLPSVFDLPGGIVGTTMGAVVAVFVLMFFLAIRSRKKRTA